MILEFVWVLLFLAALLMPVAAIAGVVMAYRARNDIAVLSSRVASSEAALDELRLRLQGSPPAPPASSPGAAQPTPPEPAKPAEVKPAAPTPAAPPPWVQHKPSSVPPIAAKPVASPTLAPPPAADGEGLEARLGGRWSVWAGGLALALGGLFLVRYSIEAGLIGPAVRILLGALLAAGLLAGGEWMRRNRTVFAPLPSADIPSILTAAGSVVAFGTVYAAHALYGFLGPASAFTLLGVVGMATMLAALLHGPAIAGLGLAGSFLTPILVSSQQPRPWPVVLFLLAVTLFAYLLARARRWLWLAVSATAGACAWGVLLLMLDTDLVSEGGWAALTHVALQLALAALFIAIEPNAGTRDEEAAPDRIAALTQLAVTGVAVLGLASVRFSHAAWLPFAWTAIALLLATAWISAPVAVASVLAGLVALAAILLWPGLSLPPDGRLMAPWAEQLLRLPENVSALMTFAALASLAIGLLSSFRIVRSPGLPLVTAALYALAATVVPLLALVLVYLRVTQFDTSIPFASAGVLLAGVFAYGASHLQSLERAAGPDKGAVYRLATGAFAAAALAAIAFTLVAALSRGYLTVALSLAALGAAYVSVRLDIPLLRAAISALGLIVLARLVWNPRVMGTSTGSLPILNWLLFGYGVPALAFWAAGRLLVRRGQDLAVALCDGLATGLAGLLVYFQIRHALHGGDILSHRSTHLEQGLLATASIALAHVTGRLGLSQGNRVLNWAALAYSALAVFFGGLGLIVAHNPYLTNEVVLGGTLFSSLLPAYLLPALGALYLARTSREVRPRWYTTAAASLGLVLAFLYVTLTVRHGFHGPRIGMQQVTKNAEIWAYSAAWLALGVVLLAYGLWRRSLEARIVSAGLVIFTALKIVLVDLAGISGLWRALSFLCLGFVLMGIGLVYQRLILARPAPGAKPAPAQPEPEPKA